MKQNHSPLFMYRLAGGSRRQSLSVYYHVPLRFFLAREMVEREEGQKSPQKSSARLLCCPVIYFQELTFFRHSFNYLFVLLTRKDCCLKRRRRWSYAKVDTLWKFRVDWKISFSRRLVVHVIGVAEWLRSMIPKVVFPVRTCSVNETTVA